MSVSVQALGPYVKEVVERCQFFADWVNNGPPTVYWISAFFFTQASISLCSAGECSNKQLARKEAFLTPTCHPTGFHDQHQAELCTQVPHPHRSDRYGC